MTDQTIAPVQPATADFAVPAKPAWRAPTCQVVPLSQTLNGEAIDEDDAWSASS